MHPPLRLRRSLLVSAPVALVAPIALVTLLVAGCAPQPEPSGFPAHVADAISPVEPRARADEQASLPEDAPDLVIVTLDTLRADHLGYHGYFRDTSPNIDRLAAESLRFTQCLAPMATTLPTHTSLLTGVWPNEHGVLANVKHGGQRFRRSERLFTVAEYLQGIGYHTAAFVSGLPLKRSFGLGGGFDSYAEPPKHQLVANKTTKRALAWLEGHDAEPDAGPLFLWAHYYDPHSPYEPPGKFARRFDAEQDAEAFEAFLAPRHFVTESVRPGEKARLQVTTDIIDAYDGEIAYTDEHVGRLLDALRARARWSRTVVVLTADHGEGLGQHGIPGHGQTWNEQLHVPLLIRLPEQEPRDVPGPMSLVDVLPTLLARIELPDEARLASQLSGRDVLASEPRPVLGQISGRQEELLGGMRHSLTSDPWKLIRQADGTLRLYHLTEDPFELEDRHAQEPDVCATLLAELDAQLEAQRERATRFAGNRSEPAGVLDEQALEGLRALGYLGSE